MALEPINCTAHSRAIEEVYQKIVRDADPNTTWMIISPNSSKEYEPEFTGSSFSEYLETFDETKVQYGFGRVIPPGSDVAKNILIGWCPDSATMKTRASFAANFGTVANNVLKGYHVQITARDEDDLNEKDILDKVSASAGARYSIQATSTANKPRSAVSSKPTQTPASSALKPTAASKPKTESSSPSTKKVVPDISEDGWDEPEVEERDFTTRPLKPNASSYQPIGKIDLQKVIAEEKAKEDPRLINNSDNSVVGTKPPVSSNSLQRNDDNVIKGFTYEKSPAELWAARKAASVGNSANTKTETSSHVEVDNNFDNEEKKESDVNDLRSKFENLASNTEPAIISPKLFSVAVPEKSEPVKMDLKKFGTPLPGMQMEDEEKEAQDNDDDWDEEESNNGTTPLPSLPTRETPNEEPEVEEEEPKIQKEEPKDEESVPYPPSRTTVNTSSGPPPPPRRSVEPQASPTPSAIAEYDYDAAEDNELTFEEGAKIINIEFVDDDWWLGEVESSGEKGLFPSNYVSLKN